jgi:hypothetical protein
MGRVQCIPAVRASRLIERVLVDAGVCFGRECFVLFSLLCRLSHLSLFFAVLFLSWSAEKKPVAEPSGLVVPTPCESETRVRVRVEPVGCCRELRSK